MNNKIQYFLINRCGKLLFYLIPQSRRDEFIGKLLAAEFFNIEPVEINNFIDRIIQGYFVRTYNSEFPNEYYREIIKKYVWGGKTGKIWHERESGNEGNLAKYAFWRKQMTEQASEALKIYPQIRNIIEIGCGDGAQLIKHINLWGSDKKYIGIDLSREQIIENRLQYEDRKELKFFYGDAGKVLKTNPVQDALYIFFGTLVCFTGEEMKNLFRVIWNQPGSQIICLSEWNKNFNPELELESRAMSPTLYNHAYSYVLQQCGFEIIQSIHTLRSTVENPDDKQVLSENQNNYIRTFVCAIKNINHAESGK